MNEEIQGSSAQEADTHRDAERPVLVAEALASMSREEKSQLLYAECRAVDNGGLLNLEQMNHNDCAAMSAFEHLGLLAWDYLDGPVARCGAWVALTDAGWAVAHAARRERAVQHEVVAHALKAHQEIEAALARLRAAAKAAEAGQ